MPGRVKIAFSTEDPEMIIRHFLRTEKCKNVIVREGEISCESSPWSSQYGVIIDMDIREATSRDPDTEEEKKVPCVYSLMVKLLDGDELDVVLDNWNEGRRVAMAKVDMRGIKVKVMRYVLGGKIGYIIQQDETYEQ